MQRHRFHGVPLMPPGSGIRVSNTIVSFLLLERHLTRKNTVAMLAVTWIGGLFWPIMPFFGWGHYEVEQFGTSCTLAWTKQTANDISLNVATTIACFIAPLAIMAYCYAKVNIITRYY